VCLLISVQVSQFWVLRGVIQISNASSGFNFCGVSIPASTGQVLYFGFDRVSGSNVYDDSGSKNNGELTSLATVTKTSGTCGNGLKLHGGESWHSTVVGNVKLL